MNDADSSSVPRYPERAESGSQGKEPSPVREAQGPDGLVGPANNDADEGQGACPFCGSGSTAFGCIAEGWPLIGIETDSAYFKLANARIVAVSKEGE